MKNIELHTIWKNIDSEIKLKTTGEINQLLASKTKKTMNKFLFIICLDILVSVGLIVFLIITGINRLNDIYYLINNSILILLALTSLLISLLSIHKLRSNKYNLSLKDWLEERIKSLTRWLLGKYSKLYIPLIPILLIMINLSIHVYYEYKPFVEVLKNEESLWGLAIGLPFGLFASFFTISKIRKYQLKNLELLKEIHEQL